MPKQSRLHDQVFAATLTLNEALARVDLAEIPESSKLALRSTAIGAVRQALRDGCALPSKDEALRADIRELLPILHISAGEYARQLHHAQPNENVSRAHRFVEIVTGKRFDTKRLSYPCPEAFKPIADALVRCNAQGEIAFIAKCCRLAGVQNAPEQLPDRKSLDDAAVVIYGPAGIKRLKDALSMYRTGREALLNNTSPEDRGAVGAQFAFMPTGTSKRTCHLGVEERTRECVRALGHAPDEMTAEQMFDLLFPDIASDFAWWSKDGPGSSRSESYIGQCHASLLRVCGWAIRAGKMETLQSVKNLMGLFTCEEQVAGTVQLNPRLARAVAAADDTGSATVSLLEHIAEHEAAASLSRSTVTSGEGRDDRGRPWFTHAIWQNCSRIWDMTQGIYRGIGTQGSVHAMEWALVESRWGHLQKELSTRAIPAEERVTAKDKAKMIRTVTLPQLACVALPCRRREIYVLRNVWQQSIATAQAAGYENPESHPAVIQATQAYFDNAAVPFLALAIALDDGLRRKQYTRGRLGDSRNFRIVLRYDDAGLPNGIGSLSTWWSGDKADPSHLKIRATQNRIARRDDRTVTPGCVDFSILWDIVSWWRPRQLIAAGVYTSLKSYDLQADLASGIYALFPSAAAKAGAARADCSRTDIGPLAGRELHRVTRSFLRPNLPDWEMLTAEWRGLWAIHILRLLTATYWGGVRNEWSLATYLTRDTEPTLRKSYNEIQEQVALYSGRDVTDWEHPQAYDHWMDRIFRRLEVFDPLSDEKLPLPPCLSSVVDADISTSKAGQRRRIRRARPDQNRREALKRPAPSEA